RQRRAFKNATQQPEANIKPEAEHPQQHVKTAITPAKAEGKLVTPKQGPVKTLHDEVESWQKKLEQFASNARTKKVKPFSYDAVLQTTPAPEIGRASCREKCRARWSTCHAQKEDNV